MTTLDAPAVDLFEQVGEKLHDEVVHTIDAAIRHQPRSLQKRIGPSELGDPCDRWVLHKLAGDSEPERPQTAWKPAIGTAVHAYLENIFDAANTTGTQWVTEHKVTVGALPNGDPITGSCDLFHIPTGTVIDFKVVGDRQLANYRANGPSEQYRRQAHCYGGGFMLDDHPAWGTPQRVAILFLPRDRAFESHYWWQEPWSPQVWAETVQRVQRLYREWETEGMPAAADKYPLCDNEWCHWCRELEREAGASARTSLFDDFPRL